MRGVTLLLLTLLALLAFTACGKGGSSAPVDYNPQLRYPGLPDYSRYYDPDYSTYSTVPGRITSSYRTTSSIWSQYDSFAGNTYLTPIGAHREELRNWGARWLGVYADAHFAARPGALAIPPAGYIFADGPVETDLEGSTTVLLNTTTGGQAYTVYALKEIPQGYCITQVALIGDWSYISAEAYGGLNLGVSCFNRLEGEFTGYYLSGDLYHPDHWTFDCSYGITPSYDGAAYIVVLVHDGLEARIDGITVTIERVPDNSRL